MSYRRHFRSRSRSFGSLVTLGALSLGLLAGAGMVGACAEAARTTAPAPAVSSTLSAPPPSDVEDHAVKQREAALRARLSRMTLEEKIGQVFMVGFAGDEAHERSPSAVARNNERLGAATIATAIKRYHVGGVIYFGYAGNLSTPRQIVRLSNDMQRRAAAGGGVPLLIATDQEGGIVERVPPPATQFPGNMALGADGDPRDATKAALVTGREMKGLGINMVLAPVVDVASDPRNTVIGVRSFGADPRRVASLAAASVRGYREAGVACAAKHFPGHGATHVDSHVGLPVVARPVSQLRRVDLPPFEAAIAADVDAVMVGHIAVPALDRTRQPATFSQSVVSGWLRRRLDFKGVVVTDALNMAGASAGSGTRDSAVQAFKAGADVLLMPPNLASSRAALLREVRRGSISEKRLDASVLRILRLKQSLGLLAERAPRADLSRADLGSSAHRKVALRIAKRSITLLRAEAGVVPLHRQTSTLVVSSDSRRAQIFTRALRRAQINAVEVSPRASGAGVIATLQARSRDFEQVVVLCADSDDRSTQNAILGAASASGRKVILVHFGDPQALARLSWPATCALGYDDGDISVAAAAAAVAGVVPFRGRLPVAIAAQGGSAHAALGAGVTSLPRRQR